MSQTTIIPNSTIAGLVIAGLLCFIIPIGAVIIYKLKNKEVSLLSALWGTFGFLVFAMGLEQALHMVMIPVVQNNIWAMAFYGAFAAGIFEETARFLIFKFVMKKSTNPKDSIMYGIGHGGIEAILVAGMSLISYAMVGVLANTVGMEQMLAMTGATDEATIAVATQQVEALKQQSVGMCFVSVFERILAMILHISLSVMVYRAAKDKSKIWLFPVAIVLHAAVDFPAVFCQHGLIPIWALYIVMIVLDVIFVYLASRCYKAMKNQEKV